jgi:hypothetical protein
MQTVKGQKNENVELAIHVDKHSIGIFCHNPYGGTELAGLAK